MLFDQNIKTPSHEKIVLSTAVAVTETNSEGGNVSLVSTDPLGQIVLDENDSIRLAAFLNRFYREQNQDIVRAEAARVKASREAKKARYEARRPTGDRYAGPGLEGI